MTEKRGDGEGTITQRSDGRWAAAVTLPSGRRRWVYARTRPEVEEKLVALRKDDGRSWGDARQTVEQYLYWWLEQQAKPRVRISTYTAYRSYMERHIVPELGRIALLRLTPQHVQSFLNAKSAAGLAPQTVLHIRAILRRALGQALRQGLIARNVATLVDPPRVARHELRPLSPEQARLFLAGIRGDRLEALYSVALALGLRRGEALALTWNDVDLEAGTLTVRRTIQRVPVRGQTAWGRRTELRFDETKTAKSRRTIALPRFSVATLRAHRMRQTEERLHAGPAWSDQNLIFTRPDGQPLNEAGVTRDLQRTLARLDLPRQRFHDLRHGAASLMYAQGADLKLISATLGHSEIGITADLYTHLFPAVSRQVADGMDAMLGQGG